MRGCRGLTAAGLALIWALCASAQPADSSRTPWRPSPTLAALRSLVAPGWGQAYTGHAVKSVFYTGLCGGLAYGIHKQHRLYRHSRAVGDEAAAAYYRNDRNRLVWYLTGGVILAAMDAFVDAHLYDFDVSPQLAVSGGGKAGIVVRLKVSGRLHD